MKEIFKSNTINLGKYQVTLGESGIVVCMCYPVSEDEKITFSDYVVSYLHNGRVVKIQICEVCKAAPSIAEVLNLYRKAEGLVAII